jgi:2-oxoisovalerate dehydrogenase E1 component alpha subunit
MMGSVTGGTPRLVVPEPAYRHGEPLSFDGLVHPGYPIEAGAVDRPPIDVEAETIRKMAFSLVRVLDDSDEAVGPWAGSRTPDELVTGLRDMLLVRAFDARMLRSQRQGKTSFYMQSLGEEAISCAFRKALSPGDMNFPTYRQQGLLIADGYPLLTMINQIYSNRHDPMKGHQLPVMYSSKAQGFFTVSGNLATQYPQAVGWAMASAIRGDDRVAAGWIGDGATAESDFHAALVFASTYRAPVVLNIVNNQWAISTFQGLARGRVATFAAKGLGFGIPSIRVDGNDYPAVHAVASWAIERAREGFGPTLLEWVTYRVGAHSTSDDPSAYRPSEEASAWPLGDPVERLRRHLVTLGVWDDARHAAAVADAERAVREAEAEAESFGTLRSDDAASPAEIFDHLYDVPPPHLRRQRQQLGY